MNQPNRRSFLRWAIHGLGAVFGLVIGVPAVAYLIDGRNRPPRKADFRPVAKLSELRPNQPKEVVIRETYSDAWTLHPDELVGRVFLIRRDGDRIDAFTTTCPHLGCSINYTGSRDQGFLCPCHGGHWKFNGERFDPNNVAPRNMDSLDVQRGERVPGSPDSDPDYFILVKFQKFEQGKPQKIVQT